MKFKATENSLGKTVVTKRPVWFSNSNVSIGLLPFRRIVGPLLLMLACPNFSVLLWWILKHNDGSLLNSLHVARNQGFFSTFISVYPSPLESSALWILAVFFVAALVLTRILPGKMFVGPLSSSGYRNEYKANGTLYWISMNVLFIMGSEYGFGLYNARRYFPSTRDSGTSGNFFNDFWAGTELYPKIFGWDVKLCSNDRIGLTWWGIALLSFASKQYEMLGYVSEAMAVSVLLQWIYLLKFFVWETGYFCTVDMQHDCAGFYLCWGCLVWVPSVYTLSTHWLVTHPIRLTILSSAFLLGGGLSMIWLNYVIDSERQRVRATNGMACKKGKKPLTIKAYYLDEKKTWQNSLLLASGWWGLATHIHYIPELLAAIFWTPPVQFSFFLPYFYVVFLAILLLDRSCRDNARCASKYGKYWEEYRRLVPWQMIPYVF
ncbi:putative 7-dehydrocholesterol reductase [Cardiosporidium cionae]|uniref:7-dehydrocholesterol reductase n=1 Tax=Cardiosporidium cionae TaxID=476202 RepID=A0ABQ7J6T3_9APIC|nr:putative 7-dehydrocholesterol reductase [Cardiosporidium cionae]|eukprot:KAF8819707.1 putative 7-dehydrocholesterol reductase [Cardiosporidium cionae]